MFGRRGVRRRAGAGITGALCLALSPGCEEFEPAAAPDASPTDPGAPAANDGGTSSDEGSDADSETSYAGLPAWRSGERLRAEVVTAPGGGAQFVGWFDRHVGAACTYRVTDKGLRCLPAREESSNWYAGSDCTTPVHQMWEWEQHGTAEGEGPYLQRRDYQRSPDDPIRMFRLGALTEPEFVSQYIGGVCTPFEPNTSSGYRQLIPVALEDFVVAYSEWLPLRDGVEMENFVASDGSHRIGKIRHEGLDCAPTRVGTDWACLSGSLTDGAGGPYFVDPECEVEQMLGWSWLDDETLPVPTHALVPNGCGFNRLYATGEPVEAIYSANPGAEPEFQCYESVLSPPNYYWLLEEVESPPAPLHDTLVGVGRVRGVFWSQPEGPPAGHPTAHRFFDTALNLPCVPMWFEDGVRRCLPENMAFLESWEPLYADPECEGPRVVRFSTSAICRDERPPFAWEALDEWAPNTSESPILATYAVTPYDGPVYVHGWEGECQPSWDSQWAEFALVTAELSPEHWVEMSHTVE